MLNDSLKLFIDYSITIIPTFLIALLISAILSETLPERFFEKAIGTRGIVFVFLSSILGALIPLCACGMIPLASKLHKKGASWLIVISFLTSGNASSITSIFITLVLGLKITVFRFLFAVIFGIIVAYVFFLFFHPKDSLTANQNDITRNKHNTSSKMGNIVKEFLSLVSGYAPWVIAAVFIATFLALFIKAEDVVNFASSKNITSPFLLSMSGFPFYFCAGSDIPISKILLEKGASLGTVLAFMNGVPTINLTSLLIYQKWLGFKNSLVYLTICFLVCGFLGVLGNIILK